VSAQYPAPRRTPGNDAEPALLDAGAAGRTLLVVHRADAEQAKAHGFDPADYVTPADVAAFLDGDWRVEVNEGRPRTITGGGRIAPHARRGAAGAPSALTTGTTAWRAAGDCRWRSVVVVIAVVRGVPVAVVQVVDVVTVRHRDVPAALTVGVVVPVVPVVGDVPGGLALIPVTVVDAVQVPVVGVVDVIDVRHRDVAAALAVGVGVVGVAGVLDRGHARSPRSCCSIVVQHSQCEADDGVRGCAVDRAATTALHGHQPGPAQHRQVV
jgi:hypothetical protein